MNEKAAKSPALWTRGRGPITANPRMVELANAINALLVAPIPVLPEKTSDFVRPFAIGIGTLIEARIKHDASLSDLKVAIRNYVRNRVYFLATAQPDAMRHDVDGNPVEPVNETDRRAAMIGWRTLQDAIEKRRRETERKPAAA